MKFIWLSFLPLIGMIAFCACSSADNAPLTPFKIKENMTLPVWDTNERKSGRELIGTWTLSIDAETHFIEVKPVRTNEIHLNVTDFIGNPYVELNTIYPNYVYDLDVTISNHTLSDAYDVRIIIFTDDVGHNLENPDGWTALYDIPVGKVINPFFAYAKTEPNRVFAGHARITENLLIFIPPGSSDVQFAIDVSYPGNCVEPYSIENFQQDTLYSYTGAEANFEVDILDWQGDVSEVYIHCPEITAEQLTSFSHVNGDTWGTNIVNNTGVSAGEYKGWILGRSSGSGDLALYENVTVVVTYGTTTPLNPEILSSLSTFTRCSTVVTNGNYAYVGDGMNLDAKMMVIDISDPVNPEIVGETETLWSFDIAYKDDHVFMIGDESYDSTLHVIDVSDPTNPTVVGSLEIYTSIGIGGFDIKGNYAYIATGSQGLQIIDISDPSQPYVAESFTNGMNWYDVEIKEDLLFCACGWLLFILDISDPMNPVEISNLQTTLTRITVKDDLAFGTEPNTYFSIYDISDPENPAMISQVIPGNSPHKAAIKGNFAFIGSMIGIKVYDFSDPVQPELVTTFETYDSRVISFKNDLAYVADLEGGLLVINFENPVEPYIAGGIPALSPRKLKVVNDLAFLSLDIHGYSIVDITDKLNPEIIYFSSSPTSREIAVNDNFAFIAGNRLTILDISDPQVPLMVTDFSLPETIDRIEIRGNYLYTGGYNRDLVIIDVSDPGDPQIVSQVSLPSSNSIFVYGNYAYVAAGDGGLYIVDIEDPTSAVIVGSVITFNARDVAVQGEYALVADDEAGIKIIDVSDTANPQTIGQVATYRAIGIAVQDEYVYVADSSQGMKVFEISVPSNPTLFSSLDSDSSLLGLQVEENLAYWADYQDGFKIVKLW